MVDHDHRPVTPDRRTLFLHVGSHRTGTTSIQKFLYQNTGNLLKKGYLYPLGVRRHKELANDLFSYKTTIRELFAQGRKVKDISDQLNSEADRSEHDVSSIIISDEDICARKDFRILQQFQEHFDLRIVFSVRRQDTWLESWYLQNIKWQWNPELSHCTFGEFLDRREKFHWIHYDTFVSSLEELFDPENVLLSVFEKDQMPAGPVIHFCRLIGLDDLTGFKKLPHDNPSMSAEITEFARHLPLDQLSNPEKLFLINALKKIDKTVLGNTGKQSEHIMQPELRHHVMREYANGNQRLARRRFGRERLFLEPLPDLGLPLAELRIPDKSAEVIERLVAPLVVELTRKGKAALTPDNGRDNRALLSARRGKGFVRSLKLSLERKLSQ